MADNMMDEKLSAKQTSSTKLDADYATEAAAFSKSEILKNSSMAILAQANSRGSRLLQLLQ